MKRFLFIFLVLLLSLPAVWPFFQKGFFWTQDIIYLARIQAASHALADGQFPLRWVSDFRYGEPLFNYYAPLPYYLASFVHLLGFDFITTAKILFIIITAISGLLMYFLAKEYWGKWGGFLSTFLYIYAPYRAVDLYVRGTLSEVFAFVWFPAIFLTYHRYFQTQNKKYLWLGSLSLALLVLAHNIMSLIFIPFFLAFIIFSAYLIKKKKLLIPTFFSFILGLGLSTFFWVPAFFEKGLVQSQKTVLSLDNFVNQFVKFQNFFKPNWNGFSITHELGIVHLVFAVLAIISAIILFRNNKKNSFFIIFLFLLLLISLFMQSVQSLNFWLFIPPLQFVQFPWRFAGLSIFFLSFLGGSFLYLIKSPKLSITIVGIAIITTLFLQKNYFQPPQIQSNATDQNFIILEDAYLPKDYVPIGVKIDLPKKINGPVIAKDYSGLPVINIVKKSNFYSFNLNLEKPEEIVLPVYYFPGWRAFNKSKEIALKKQPQTGLILLSLPSGDQEISLKLTDTPLRRNSGLVSLLSLGAIGLLLLITTRKKSSA